MTKEAFSLNQVMRIKRVARRISSLQAFIYRLSNGQLWGKVLAKYPIMVVSTVGRKSKKLRYIPLIKVVDHDRPILVASMGGAPINPDWFHNVSNEPRVHVQIGKKNKPYFAKRATEEEKIKLWPIICGVYPDYQAYQERTQRNIPVFICTPLEDDE